MRQSGFRSFMAPVPNRPLIQTFSNVPTLKGCPYMKDLSFAVVVGAFILTAIPAYAAEGAPGENAGAATAGHPITPQELQKACGPLISDARAQRIAYFKEYIRVNGSSKETKQLLARARDKTIPDVN